jgi:HK97 family phage major capsid protein
MPTLQIDETRVRDLRAAIASAEDAARRSYAEADALAKDLAERGINPLTDKDAFAQVEDKYRAAERHRAEATTERARLDSLLEEARSGSSPEHDAYRTARGAPRLMLTRDDVEGLRQAALNNQPAFRQLVDYEAAPFADITHELSPIITARQARLAERIPTEVAQQATPRGYRPDGRTEAAMIGPGELKPTATPVWIPHDRPVRKAAAVVSAVDEVIADFGGAERLIASDLLGAYVERENAQILTGSGEGFEVIGLLTEPDAQTRDRDGTEPYADTLAKAQMDVLTHPDSLAEPNLQVLHPLDYLEAAILDKDLQGAYRVGHPTEAGPRSIWSVPVLLTTAIAQGTALVLNVEEGARLFYKDAPRVETGWSGTDFAHDRRSFRIHGRFSVWSPRPKALVVVTFEPVG